MSWNFIPTWFQDFWSRGPFAAFLTTEVEEAIEGTTLSGRIIGCEEDAIGKELSSLINRKGYRLHLCMSKPCTAGPEEALVHAVSIRWFAGGDFDAPYMRPWASWSSESTCPLEKKRRTRETPARQKREEEKEGWRERRWRRGSAAQEETGRQREAQGCWGQPVAGQVGCPEKAMVVKRGEDPPGEEEVEVIPSGDSEASESESAEEPRKLGAGDKLRRAPTTLALADVKEEEEDGPDQGRRKKRKKAKRTRKEKDPAAQLLAQAAQLRKQKDEEKKEKQRKKKDTPGSTAAKALVKLLTGEGKQEKKSKKEKGKKKKRKKKGGGDPGSGSSSWEEESEKAEEDSESSSSELLAPLQKRSAKQPGAVLKMLVQHARSALDQSALVETSEAKGGDRRGQDELLLQSPGSPVLHCGEPGYERIPPFVDLPGRAEKWPARQVRRQPSQPVPGDSHGGERRNMAVSAVPRAAPAGTYAGSTNLLVARGEETRQTSLKEPEQRGVEEAKERGRRLERLRQRRRVERQGKRKGKGFEQRRTKRLQLAREPRLGESAEGLVEQSEGQSGEQGEQAGRKGCEDSLEAKEDGLPQVLASPRAWGTSLKDFEEVCRAGGSLKRMGALLAWLTLRAELEAFSAGKVTPLRAVSAAGGCWLVCRASLPT